MIKILNKRGSALDLIMLGVIILFAATVILVGFKIGNSFNTEIQGMTSMPTEGKTAGNLLTSYYPSIIDNSFLFLVIGISIVTLLMAALVKVHPIFLVFFIIGLTFIIFLSAIFSNIYETIANDPNFVAEAAQLTNISFVVSKLPFIIGIVGILLMIVMYKSGED